MKKWMAALAWLAWQPFPAAAETVTPETYIKTSREAVKVLQKNLKTELQAAMREGGPVHAIDVCHVKAPEISEEVSGGLELSVGRTALRVRNPENVPDSWEQAMLESFKARLAAGEPLNELEAYMVEDDEFRYMKAIPMGGVCMACHGTSVNEKVRKKIRSIYPEDQATGFSPGEIRGAFTVRVPM